MLNISSASTNSGTLKRDTKGRASQSIKNNLSQPLSWASFEKW
jgi:hypothetical protein